MPLDQLTPYLPATAVVAGVLLLILGQRAGLRALAGRLWPTASIDEAPSDGTSADEDESEICAHEAYACLRRLLDEVKDCPKATDALQLVVLQALVSGTDSPHYRVTWEDKP